VDPAKSLTGARKKTHIIRRVQAHSPRKNFEI
jgi:hypothetical protein